MPGGANRVASAKLRVSRHGQVGTVIHFAVSTPTRLPPTVDTISRSLVLSHVRCESNCRSNMAVHSPVHSLCIYPGRLWGEPSEVVPCFGGRHGWST
jgi:hypothetical protein